MSVHPQPAQSLEGAKPAQAAQAFILGGSEQFGKSGAIMPVYDPRDQVTQAGACHCAEPLHLEVIERAAEQGFAAFRGSKPSQRAEILSRLGDLLAARREEVARLITLESGKPIRLSRHEAQRGAQLCRAYALEAERLPAQILHTDGREARISRFPLGPALAITPYNFPLNLVLHKLAPAIAAGCSMTLKPAPQTPLTALLVGRLALEAGYTALSVIPTASHELPELLVKSNAFAKLSFTGSAAVGWRLRELAGKKAVTLELGGNAALILDDRPAGASWREVAERVAFGAFAYSGQICISVQRLFIRETLLPDFLPELVAVTRALKVGDPMREDTDIGPMIRIEEVQRARHLIKDALRAGANVVYGGNTFNALTLNPSILDRTTPEMRINAEEAFAPLLTVTPYRDFEQALRDANHSRYGLQAGLYTNDPRQVMAAYHALDVGGLVINDIPTYRADELPYGGVKDSGLGREGVLAGIDAYSYPKVLIQPG